MVKAFTYFSPKSPARGIPNQWDAMAFILVLGVIGLFAWGAKQMSVPYHIGQPLPVSLDPRNLPEYALFTVLRMFIAMFFSLLFTLTVGTWAAKSRSAEKIIIPCIDILQSVPVIGFLTITISMFIALFPGSLLGPQCASIFLVFTAQVWNITLSFYQSLRTVPIDYKEAADMFHLSAWQKFWRIEVPFAMPGLLWNAMLSMSGSWIFLIASEAITVNNQDISLPGVGSYLGLAIKQADMHAVGYAIITMLAVIFLYDQFLFRPLLKWAEKFKAEYTAQEKTIRSWVTLILHRTRALRYLVITLGSCADSLINLQLFRRQKSHATKTLSPLVSTSFHLVGNLLLFSVITITIIFLAHYILTNISGNELLHVFVLGLYTAARVFAVVIISTIIWVPIGVWIGLRPQWAGLVQPIAQFFAAFPMNVLFPVVVFMILQYHLNVNIWTTPLMLLGTQWYILFNVIAGASALPKDLKQVAENFGVRGWQWWQQLILPGIFPYYITGTITAIGNAWNTTVIAEMVSWGHTTLIAKGLGAYIMQYGNAGDFPRVALGMAIMTCFVLILNRLLWRPIYNLAQTRYRLD